MPTENDAAAKKVVHLRLDADIAERLAAFATATRRSQNAAAEVLLDAALKAEGHS